MSQKLLGIYMLGMWKCCFTLFRVQLDHKLFGRDSRLPCAVKQAASRSDFIPNLPASVRAKQLFRPLTSSDERNNIKK